MNPFSARSTPQDDDLPVTVAASGAVVFDSQDALAVQLAVEMNQAWGQGRRVTTHQLLTSHPGLRRRRDAVLRLIFEESRLRREHGLTLTRDDWLMHFPEWRGNIEALLESDSLIEPEIAPTAAKLLGRLHDFQLICELGRGGQGRVYLATQPQLADRPVVVKVTPCCGREHLSLARLQHTHIAPLLWAQDYPDENQRILCMPYFGSLTLARLLTALQAVPLARRTGQDIVDVLDEDKPEGIPASAPRGPARQLLARATYAQAITWMGACLADALDYAHQRDLLHLDLKPSNILWTRDGQPMLLDFHLARAPVHPNGPRPQGLGGTPMWMAPELESALHAVCAKQPVLHPVDGRADVFELGLVLHQALGGPVPFALDHPPLLESINPQVSPGLGDIVRRCLARQPADRFAGADVLAAELRRHLSDMPLRNVANRSLKERWQKWRRRKPHALSSVLWALGLLAITSAVAVSWLGQRVEQEKRDQAYRHAVQARIVQAEHALAQAKAHVREQKYELAVATLEGGRALLNDVPEADALTNAFIEQRQIAQQQHARRLMHDGVEMLRGAVVADALTASQIELLASKCRDLWERRDLIIGAKTPIDVRLWQDALDLAIIWSDLRLRLTPAEHQVAERQKIIAMLNEAERRFGGSPLLDHMRRQQPNVLSEKRDAESPVTAQQLAAWEHVAFARQLLQANASADLASGIARMATAPWIGDLLMNASLSGQPCASSLAAWHLERALALEPDHYWGHYYQGVAAYRCGRFADAGTAFRVCVDLRPLHAGGFHNRALAAAAVGDFAHALADYSRALELDPQFAAAALNRALVNVQLRNYVAATADLQLAQACGASANVVQANLAMVAKLAAAQSRRRTPNTSER